jgi:hypothetical protein
MEQSARLPAGGAVTGWASLRLHRAGFFDGLAPDGRTPIPVPLVVPRGSKLRGDEEVVLSREPLVRGDTRVLHGIPCTAPRRALFDEMRRTRCLREAVVAMDMAAAALLVSVRQMQEYVAAHRGWRRSSLARRALPLASERSRSPYETRTRLIWVLDAGLPAPLVNQPVWDLDGTLLGIADLLDEAAGVVGEFDGADHRLARRHTSDIAREEAFRRRRLEVFHITGLDVGEPARVVARMRFHRSRAAWLPPAERPWTTTPPRGWPVEESLDEYLAEQEVLQAMYRGELGEVP